MEKEILIQDTCYLVKFDPVIIGREIFLSAYERCKNTYQTAKILGVSQPTVVRKLKKYKQNIV